MCRIIAYYKERQKVVSELRFAIVKVQKNRDYNCYIKLVYTMYYLDNWIFKDRICKID